jgi:hypothetical protein
MSANHASRRTEPAPTESQGEVSLEEALSADPRFPSCEDLFSEKAPPFRAGDRYITLPLKVMSDVFLRLVPFFW